MEDIRVPSGFEVESASLHTPPPPGVKDKVMARVRPMARNVSQSVRTRAALYAGIATAAGLALGITGRVVRHRKAAKKQQRPTLLIIEGAC